MGKAINTEYKTLGLEKTWEALWYYLKEIWIPSHMVLVHKYANETLRNIKLDWLQSGSRQP
jgi:hypothetical protein